MHYYTALCNVLEMSLALTFLPYSKLVFIIVITNCKLVKTTINSTMR